MSVPPPSEPRGNGLVVAPLVAAAVAIYGYAFTCYLWPLGHFGGFRQHWPYLLDGLYALFRTPGRGAHWRGYMEILAQSGYLNGLYLRLSGLAGGSLAIALWLFARCYAIRRGGDLHVRGLEYIDDPHSALRRAQRQAALERRADRGAGIAIHPALRIGANRENLGLLAVGAPGSGKTQFLLPIVQQVIGQGHRAVIFDYKGEYTATLPLADERFTLLAPWDARSAVWHIAADVTSRADARLIAQQLIRDSDDPMWSNSSRQVLTGLIHYLCQTKPGAWRFTDLARLVSASNAQLAYVMRRGNREVVRIIENLMEDGKTAQSVMINLTAYMAGITDLAEAWDDAGEALPEAFLDRAFSIKRWLADDYAGPKVLVLQGSARYQPLMQGLLSSFLALLIAHIVDSAFPEAVRRKDDYRLFFFLDEFPRLGRVPDLEALIAVGRAKGVRLALGFQDIAQVRHLYGPDLASAWFSHLGIQFFGRVAPGDTANWIANIIGKHEVDRLQRSLAMNPNGTPQGPAIMHNAGWQTLETPILLPSQLATDLDAGAAGVTALLHCTGWPHLYRLRWPLTRLRERRPASVPVQWTRMNGSIVLRICRCERQLAMPRRRQHDCWWMRAWALFRV